jgi:uncharacterized OsmC-like protein
MSIITFKATSRSLGGLAVENNARNFKVIMDEPKELGGMDSGMTPVEMVLCALGSCQCIVAKAFAKLYGIELEDFWVELEGDLDSEGYLKGKHGLRPGLQEVRYSFHFVTDAPRAKVENFADFIKRRCPIVDTLLYGAVLLPGKVIIEKRAKEYA